MLFKVPNAEPQTLITYGSASGVRSPTSKDLKAGIGSDPPHVLRVGMILPHRPRHSKEIDRPPLQTSQNAFRSVPPLPSSFMIRDGMTRSLKGTR